MKKMAKKKCSYHNEGTRRDTIPHDVPINHPIHKPKKRVHKKNQERASWAMIAVQSFQDETGLTGDSLDTAILDLLGDLMHLCDVEGISFESCLERGKWHYDYELTSPND
jgi:hypothetical protein